MQVAVFFYHIFLPIKYSQVFYYLMASNSEENTDSSADREKITTLNNKSENQEKIENRPENELGDPDNKKKKGIHYPNGYVTRIP